MSSPYALFITRNDIIKNTPIQGAVDADRLLNFVRTAQDKYLLNLLGTVLFYKLQLQIVAGTPFTGYYKDLMEDHVKPTLIWYSVCEYLPFSAIQFKNEGPSIHSGQTKKSPLQSEIDYLEGKARQNADWYSTRTQNYLLSYSRFIPEYLQSVGNQTEVYPDMGNTYFGGINL